MLRRDIATRLHSGSLDTGLTSITGTGFIRLFTGIIYFLIGPTKDAQPFCIAAGPDGNIWFTLQANRIARLSLKK